MSKIGVIGIGKLGLCLALNIEAIGYEVIGIDHSEDLVRSLGDRSYFSLEPGVNERLRDSTKFTTSTDFERLRDHDPDLIFILVDTPSTGDGSYDHSKLEKAIDSLLQLRIRKKTTELIIGCTVMPGFCERIRKKVADHNYRLAYNPEFIALGSILADQRNADMILIGEEYDNPCKLLPEIYERLCARNPAIHRMSLLSAEIAKIALNCFLTAKISFANAIGDLAVLSGADPDNILAALGSDSRIGAKFLRYGYGYGGPCLPRDNRALCRYGQDVGYELLIGQAVDEVNQRHLEFQFQRAIKTYPPDEEILFFGVAYKDGTTILEGSQKLALAEKLALSGRKVVIQEKMETLELLKARYGGLFSYVLR